MDRRSWLWRRKSSEKSPSGETESSGSVSSHSERFSDDQTLSNHNIQSPEVTSKAAPDEENIDSVKTLSGKLTEALLNIRAKEDLVKQHSKVAEEAVSGWERAENEVSVLKKQNDALSQKNLILEERLSHLDGALKECLRQHRQARDEQEEKIHDAVTSAGREWESKRSELENQLSELRIQLQNANVVADDARSKLEAAEKEKSILKLELHSKAEELELKTRERDLSIHAAETASKQRLDSIKKMAKIEAECLQLKARARRATYFNDNQSITASSVYVESFTDSHSDNGERVQVIEDDSYKMGGFELERLKHDKSIGRSLFVPSVEIDLMDDFLEMERLASLPERNSESCTHARDNGEETRLRDELEAMINRTTELEDTLTKLTAEIVSLEIALSESQIQLKASEDQLKQTEANLLNLKIQLALANEATRDAQKEVECSKVEQRNLNKFLDEAEKNLVKIHDQLNTTNQAKSIVEVQLEDANVMKAELDSRHKLMELELETACKSISSLEREVEKEKNVSREAVAKCDILEAEISRTKLDARFQRSAIVEEFRINQDKDLAVAASKFAECQQTISSLGRQLKALATLEDFLVDSERQVTVL